MKSDKISVLGVLLDTLSTFLFVCLCKFVSFIIINYRNRKSNAYAVCLISLALRWSINSPVLPDSRKLPHDHWDRHSFSYILWCLMFKTVWIDAIFWSFLPLHDYLPPPSSGACGIDNNYWLPFKIFIPHCKNMVTVIFFCFHCTEDKEGFTGRAQTYTVTL